MDWMTEASTLEDELETAGRQAARNRLTALRRALVRHDLGAALLFDSVNLRYACGVRNMQVNTARNPGRYVFVPAEGPVVLFEYSGCAHLAEGAETVDEIRPAHALSPLFSARPSDHLRRFAADIAALMPPRSALGIDRPTAETVTALEAAGVPCRDVTLPLEQAKALKSAAEIRLIRESVRRTEQAVRHMAAGLEPGRSEVAVWARLHESLIAQNGEYCETRLFTSGEKTNPWFQEAGEKIIRAGEMVALDTDCVGCYGYYTDFSRTFLAGDGRPSDTQRRLYALAQEQLEHNLSCIGPGIGFRSFAERAWPIPETYHSRRYALLVHGNGMTGEYPFIHHADNGAETPDDVFRPGMTVCVESYIGDEAGGEGVKLEEQVLITESGVERLSAFPYDERLGA
jgi:Xaa-Pro aminopeptidase